MLFLTDQGETPIPPNKALHRTAIPLRAIAAGELGRYVFKKNVGEKICQKLIGK